MSGYRVAAQVRSGLWFVPVMCVIAGVVLSFVTIWIDEQTGYDLIPRSFTGGPGCGAGHPGDGRGVDGAAWRRWC